MLYTQLFALGALGMVVGSFLGLLVLRVPKGQPVIFARSACPYCGHQLRASELIPVASWILQRRRCRACGSRLSIFYPVVELSAAAVSIAAGLKLHGLWIIAGCVGGWLLLALAAWGWSRTHPQATL